MQAGLLFESLRGSAGLYIQQVVISCEDDLDHVALQEAWEALVRRHEALRTSFQIGDSAAPRGRVHADATLGIVALDWRDLDTDAAERRWTDLLSAERTTGFEPAVAPLMRVAICRFPAAPLTRILWCYHHAMLDGRSRLALLAELFERYREALAGAVLIPPPPPPFSRFAAWAAGRGRDAATEAFWRERLSGIEEPTPAPGAASGSAGTEAPGVLSVRLGARLSRMLHGFVEARSVSLATVLQGVYGLLLAQESDRDDILFASTRAGRRSAPFETGEMVGLLMVTSPVRLTLRPDMSVLELLAEVDAFGRPFEHAPLSDIIAWSAIARPHRLADNLFSFERATMNSLLRRTDPEWRRRDVQLIERLDFPLTLEAWGDDDVLVKVLFDGRTVDREAATRVLGRYIELLECCASDTEQPVSAVGSLAPARIRELSGELEPPLDGALVAARLARQVELRPEAIAIEHASERVTYAELGRRLERIALDLRTRGAGPGSLVAVAMARTAEMICTLLAIHRIGAAYVPLDPRYPPQRLRFMLEDSGAALVVTDQASRASLDGRPEVELLLVDDPPIHPRPAGKALPVTRKEC
jgi:hypothetical protein